MRQDLHLMFSNQETEGNRGMLLEDHSESRLVRKEKRKKKQSHAAQCGTERSQAGFAFSLLALPSHACLHQLDSVCTANGTNSHCYLIFCCRRSGSV